MLGTAISALLVGFVVYGFSLLLLSQQQRVRLLDALFFGAVVSATDPVTMLAIFNVSMYYAHVGFP